MKVTLPITIAIILLHNAQAFLTVQKIDRPVAFGTSSGTTVSQASQNGNNNVVNGEQPGRTPPTFLASHVGSTQQMHPFAVAHELEFTPWHDNREVDFDGSVDLSYPTIIMACALSMALGFGLGYGT